MLAASTGVLIIGAILILLLVVPMVFYALGLGLGGLGKLFGSLPRRKRTQDEYAREWKRRHGIIDGADIARSAPESEPGKEA